MCVQIVSSLQSPESTVRCLKVNVVCDDDPTTHQTVTDVGLLHLAVYLQAKLALAQEAPSAALEVLGTGERSGAEENCLMGLALWLRGEAKDRREGYRHFVKVTHTAES